MDRNELRLVLERAEEIQSQRDVALPETRETDSLIAAAVEAGLSRDAVVQALQERAAISGELAAGDLVFAPSADGYLYVARVTEISGEVVHVRFLSGSDHRLLRSQLRPFSLLPGQKVRAQWPAWGWWTCTVIRYNAELLSVRLSDGWGSEETISISDVCIPSEERAARTAWKPWAFHAVLVLAGGALGSLVTFLLMRR